ncbi:hypothetical protein [Pseudorhodobacter sp.]|uniref:hypothetical protein n=1 Tax=Pseudorhodobacter sp. TaxID=1934400 RepID=UPI002647A6ED|nr:hypothetical protein [Pseudorhodobacter sp.]MDN5788495.1 hypothetical protein [Pseudorhodobacter sp.]
MPGLVAALQGLAQRNEVMSYGDLARQIAIPGPGSIARLTAALEVLMVEDAEAGHPFRAALCRARSGDGLPAPGFFDAAVRLGRFDGGDLRGFVARERAELFKAAALR